MPDHLITFAADAAGVRYRPPALRVYRAPVTRSTGTPRVRSEVPEPMWIPRKLTWKTSGGISRLELGRVLGGGAEQSQQRIENVQVAQGDVSTQVMAKKTTSSLGISPCAASTPVMAKNSPPRFEIRPCAAFIQVMAKEISEKNPPRYQLRPPAEWTI